MTFQDGRSAAIPQPLDRLLEDGLACSCVLELDLALEACKLGPELATSILFRILNISSEPFSRQRCHLRSKRLKGLPISWRRTGGLCDSSNLSRIVKELWRIYILISGLETFAVTCHCKMVDLQFVYFFISFSKQEEFFSTKRQVQGILSSPFHAVAQLDWNSLYRSYSYTWLYRLQHVP